MDNLTKKELRAIIREKRLLVDSKWKKDLSIVKLLENCDKIKKAKKVFLFYPRITEIDLSPLFVELKNLGKIVAFPRCFNKKGNMEFFAINSLDELEAGPFGILEPPFTTPETPTDTVIIVPAMAASRDFHRIGYGCGYYDRYLERYKKYDPYTIIAIYEEFVFDTIPTEDFDIPAHAYVTENGITEK